MTANGEVEEAQVYVHDLEPFVTVQILEDTPAVPVIKESSAMKTDTLLNGSLVKKPHLIENGVRIQCQHGALRSDRGS